MTAEESPQSPGPRGEGRPSPGTEGKNPFGHLGKDLPASVAVFLVAVPLCLGIAVASGAPPLAGVVTGIIGGIVVAWLSGAPLAVSGPAAGLTTIVLGAIHDLEYEGFLLAVVIAGMLQIVFGAVRAGVVALYVPSAVIKGMLASIGVMLIVKQLPHAIGYDADYFGDDSFWQANHENTFQAIAHALGAFRWPAAVISGLGLVVLFTMERMTWLKKKVPWLPPPLIAVVIGVGINQVLVAVAPELALSGDHLVNIHTGGVGELIDELSFPDWSRVTEVAIWQTGFVIAAVASIETLLCVEAIDKLDPLKRATPTNRELFAQGVGNVIAGCLGAIPMTAVVVRGSANVTSGGRTRVSAFFHGVWLLLAVLLIPHVMNLVPLAALAAVLLHVGYKLAAPAKIRAIFQQPLVQWLPFAVTIAAVLITNLLNGVLIGLGVAIFVILRAHVEAPFFSERHSDADDDGRVRIRLELSDNVTFLHRAAVSKVLHELPDNSIVEIDASKSRHVHPDVVELIDELAESAGSRGISLHLRGSMPGASHLDSLPSVGPTIPPPPSPPEAA